MGRTVIHTCAPTHLHASAVSVQAAVSAAEARKALKYADLTRRCDFRPFAVETFGAFGPSALELIDALVGRIQAQKGEVGIRSRLYRRTQAQFKPETPAELLKHIRARLHGGFCPPPVM